ncbi:MAG: hypothetical protein IJJ33_09820 [Victivallales bacterium]|nr:hypothetical protein [Victivallales bacterium]
MMNATPERLVLIDAYAQIYRCFFAVRAELTNPQGTPTNALYGIARLLLQLHRTLPSRYGAVAFDKGKCARRIALCPEYKAQRPPMPDAMRPQIDPIRQWMKAFGWLLVEQEGIEADDLIAAITRRHGECEVTIVTHDKDIMQLTADRQVFIAQPDKEKWALLGAAEVTRKFGVPPAQLRDYLALLGDSSDNIPGVPGVGAKTAVKLLQQCGSIEGILAQAENVASPKVAASLKDSAELLVRNQQLIALGNEPPAGVTSPADLPRREPDWTALLKMAEEQGFKSLIPALQKEADSAAQPSLFNPPPKHPQSKP